MEKPITIVLFVALAMGQAHAGIKCWTNDEGVRECGNAVPPEYAQKRTETLNERGMRVDVRERAKTAEELERQRRQKALEEQRRRDAERRRQEQEAYDRVLLSTFISVDDILASRDRKLTAIEGTIEMTRATIATLERKLGQYRKRADELESSGKQLPKDLAENIASLEHQIEDNRAFVERKEEEKARLNTEYERDIRRFKELTGR